MRFCSKCGNKLEDDQLYCPKCGNKEPFLKDTEQSTWKDFDTEKKDIKNVNYDFTSSAPGAQGSTLHVPRKNLLNPGLCTFGKAIRIYSIVLAILTFVQCITSFFINQPTVIPYIFIGLATIELIMVIVLFILVKNQKEYIPPLKNVYIPAIVLSALCVGFAIGSFFLMRAIHFNGLGFVQTMLYVMVNVALINTHSFKKTAKSK